MDEDRSGWDPDMDVFRCPHHPGSVRQYPRQPVEMQYCGWVENGEGCGELMHLVQIPNRRPDLYYHRGPWRVDLVQTGRGMEVAEVPPEVCIRGHKMTGQRSRVSYDPSIGALAWMCLECEDWTIHYPDGTVGHEQESDRWARIQRMPTPGPPTGW